MDGMRNRVYQKWEIQLIINEKSYVKTCSAFTPGLHSCCSCSRVAMPCATLLGSTLFRFSHCSSGDVLLSATAVGSLWCDCCCFRVMMLEEFAKILTTCCQHGWHPATVEFWLIWAGFWPQSLHCATKSLNFQIICFYCLGNMFSLFKKFICKLHIHSFQKCRWEIWYCLKNKSFPFVWEYFWRFQKFASTIEMRSWNPASRIVSKRLFKVTFLTMASISSWQIGSKRFLAADWALANWATENVCCCKLGPRIFGGKLGPNLYSAATWASTN